MANDNEQLNLDLPADAKPEVADHPSFLRDLKNGAKHALKTIWNVPEARGKIATLIVRLLVPTLPAGLGAVATVLIETLVK